MSSQGCRFELSEMLVGMEHKNKRSELNHDDFMR
jgi:hypothetical protein